MSGTLKYLAVAAATIGTLVVVSIARTSNYHADNVGTQSLMSAQSALTVAPGSITTNPIIGSDAAISTYGLASAHATDW